MKSALTAGLMLGTWLTLYALAYAAMAEPAMVYPDPRPPSAHWLPVDEVEVHYRWGGPVATWIFWPAHQIDRQIRPDEWNPANYFY